MNVSQPTERPRAAKLEQKARSSEPAPVVRRWSLETSVVERRRYWEQASNTAPHLTRDIAEPLEDNPPAQDQQVAGNAPGVVAVVKGMATSTALLVLIGIAADVFGAPDWVLLAAIGVALANLGLGQIAFLVEYGRARRRAKESRTHSEA
jgi:hypothetical protein